MQLASGTTIRVSIPAPKVTPVYSTQGQKGDPGAPGGSDAAFAAFVNDSASATRAALSATYAPKRAKVLQSFWAALADRNVTPVDIVFGPGTSLFAGTGATSRSARIQDRLLSMLRRRFPVADVPGGLGYGAGNGQYGGPTAAGAVTAVNFGLGNRASQLTAGGQTLTWGSQVATTVTVYGYATTAGDAITVTIDGGAPATITPGATGRFSQTFPLSRASHLVVVGWSAGSPIVRGINAQDGDEALGIRGWDNSKGGSKTADWLTSTGGSQDWINDIGSAAMVDPDLILIDQLANDYPNIGAATYGTQLQAVISLYRTKTSAPIVLWSAWRRATAGIDPWEDYVEQEHAVAAANPGVCVFDMDGVVDLATSPNYFFDAYHANNNGYAAATDALFEFLAPSGFGAGTTQTTSPYTEFRPQDQIRGSQRLWGTDAAATTRRLYAPPGATANVDEVTDPTGVTRYFAIDKTGRVLSNGFTARGGASFDGSAAAAASIDGQAGQVRDFVWATTAGAGATPSSRWIMRTDGSAESGANAGSAFLFMSRTDAGGSLKTIFSVVRSSGLVTWGDAVDFAFNTATGTKLGTSATQKIGFYGATPVVRPTATPAAATDAATTQTLVNDLRTKLISLGLVA